MAAEQRSGCSFLSGPKDAALQVSPVKWWFAISRDMLAKTYRQQRSLTRSPAMCYRTPTFSSPLSKNL